MQEHLKHSFDRRRLFRMSIRKKNKIKKKNKEIKKEQLTPSDRHKTSLFHKCNVIPRVFSAGLKLLEFSILYKFKDFDQFIFVTKQTNIPINVIYQSVGIVFS